MCYDPRQFWPTPTKDSYFPLRKLDLKCFAEATKTIWINNWIRLQFMWMVPPLPTCRSSVKRISVNFALLCLSDIMIKILKESQFTVELGSPGEHLTLVKPVHIYLNYCHAKILQKTIQNSFLNIQKYAQRNLVALTLASDRTNTSSVSPSHHETSFSNAYHLVSKDWFSGGPQSFSLNLQLWCLKLLRIQWLSLNFWWKAQWRGLFSKNLLIWRSNKRYKGLLNHKLQLI